MTVNWRTAGIGGLMGACVALAATFGAASLGFFPPPSDKQFERYLMAHPSIVLTMAEKAQVDEANESRRQWQEAVNKVGLKTFFDPKIAFVTGPANAKKSFVEFFDYNCAHCRNSFPLVQKFYQQHKGDTRFAFIELPIFGAASDNAARAALAARKQPDKYVAFHFAMMAEPGAIDANSMIDAAQKAGLDINKLTADVKDPAINKQIAAAHALASRTGVTGTPFFILNGQAHEGEVDEAALKALSKS
ncbi:MAG TPA: thioredoxin domain-containing protein [Rhizomicrobium sp.]|nr:thioredoxin domain-containing protein [Rhizomicrobium sp.]